MHGIDGGPLDKRKRSQWPTLLEGVASTYDGPVALSQDLMVFNVTPEQIVLRMAKTEQL